MTFSIKKPRQLESISIEQQILNSTEIKTEEDLKKFLADVSKNGTNSKISRNTTGFANRKSRNDEEL